MDDIITVQERVLYGIVYYVIIENNKKNVSFNNILLSILCVCYLLVSISGLVNIKYTTNTCVIIPTYDGL